MHSGVRDLSVLVTGGTSGIGLASVKALLEGGANVAFTGRRVETGAALEAELNGIAEIGRGRSKFISGDATLDVDRKRWVEEAIAAFGCIDVVFLNAGIVVGGSAVDTSEDAWNRCLNMNLTAQFMMIKAVLPHFLERKKGNIIACASDWGMVAAKDYVAYCVSKAALIQLVKCVALEHAKQGIRANAIAPGDTEVERWYSSGYAEGPGGAAGTRPVTKEEVEMDGSDCNPMGRVSKPQEIASAVVFLASRGCESMTGSVLVVDGGNTAR